MSSVITFDGLIYGFGTGPLSRRYLKEQVKLALSKASFNADEFVVGLKKSADWGLKESYVKEEFESIVAQNEYVNEIVNHPEVDVTLDGKEKRRLLLFNRAAGTSGSNEEAEVYLTTHAELVPRREDKRRLWIESIRVPYVGGLKALVAGLVEVGAELDYAEVFARKVNRNYTYEIDYPGVEYTTELALNSVCVVFFPSMIERFITNRIYLLNTPCWKLEELDSPEGKAIVVWAYDPDILESQGFKETDAQAKAMYDMGEYLGQGSYESDPTREWRPERLSEARSGLYEESTKTLWVTRNLLSGEDQELEVSECNDYGVILKMGYLPGDEKRNPIERVAFLFSLQEAAQINLRSLSLRGLETWYVDPHHGKQRLPLPEAIRGWNEDGTHGLVR